MFELTSYIYATTSLLIGLVCFQFCATSYLKKEIGRHFILLVVATQGAAFLSPDIITYNIVVGGTLLFMSSKRQMIAPTYLFLLVTLPMAARPIGASGTYLMNYDVSISLGVGALIALAMRSKGHFSRSVALDLPVLTLFILYVLVEARSSTATNMLRVMLEQASLMLLPYFVISRSMRSFDDVRDGLYGLTAGVTALSTLAVYEAVRTWPIYRVVMGRYGVAVDGGASVKLRAGFLRSPGPFTEPTSFAFCLALGLIAAIGCRRMFGSSTKRAIVLLIMSLGIVAPQSRGGWFGLAIGLVAMELYDRRFNELTKKIGIAVVGVLLILAVSKVDNRVASAAGLNAEGAGTVDYRSTLFTRGMQEVRSHPLIGRSPGDVRASMRDLMQGEGIIDFVNTYLYVALVSGIPGLLIFIVVFTVPISTLLRARNSLIRRHVLLFQQLSSASTAVGGIVAVMLMIAVTSMTGRTTMLAVIEIAFASVIVNNMRAARLSFRRLAASEQRNDADINGVAAIPRHLSA